MPLYPAPLALVVLSSMSEDYDLMGELSIVIIPCIPIAEAALLKLYAHLRKRQAGFWTLLILCLASWALAWALLVFVLPWLHIRRGTGAHVVAALILLSTLVPGFMYIHRAKEKQAAQASEI